MNTTSDTNLLITYGYANDYSGSKLRELIRTTFSSDARLAASAHVKLEEWLKQADAYAVAQVQAKEAQRENKRQAELDRRARVEARLALFVPFTPTGDWKVDRCSQTAGGYTRADFGGHRCQKAPKWILKAETEEQQKLFGPYELMSNGKPFCSTHRNSVAGVNRSY